MCCEIVKKIELPALLPEEKQALISTDWIFVAQLPPTFMVKKNKCKVRDSNPCHFNRSTARVAALSSAQKQQKLKKLMEKVILFIA